MAQICDFAVRAFSPKKDSVPAFWPNTILVSDKAADCGGHTLEKGGNPIVSFADKCF
jgi:hypothetical protein